MRLHRDSWTGLSAGDVAWVTEWQLVAALGWLPVVDGTVIPAPESEGGFWFVRVQAGRAAVHARVPLRDLAKLVYWAHEVESWPDLVRPPAGIRASMLAVQAALRRALRDVNPLDRMGYVSGEARGR